MSAALTDAERSLRSRISGLFATALGGALNGMTGGGYESSALDGDALEPEQPIIWKQPYSLADGAHAWLITGKDLWEGAGESILGEGVSEEDCRSTWNEIASQTMGGVAQALTAELGREVVAQPGAVDQDAPEDHARSTFIQIRNGQQLWIVRVAWSGPFARACGSAASPPEQEHVGPVRRETVASKTLDLLLDVALPVSVSFGKTSLQIREVIKLSTGSVIELDRLVSEPVEVIVNNCVIARGEVVVVDGNYGVRIIQLASREDRLKSGMSEATTRLGLPTR